MIRAKARANESLDQLLRRFKKMCEKEGLTRDIKRHAFYEKPSEVRRRKDRQVIRKRLKESRTDFRDTRVRKKAPPFRRSP